MTTFLSNLMGVVAALGLTLSGLVYMISPKAGGELLKRLALCFLGAIIGFALLNCLWHALLASPVYLALAIVVVPLGAFLAREALRPRPVRSPGRHWGAERTPLMPTHFDEEDQ